MNKYQFLMIVSVTGNIDSVKHLTDLFIQHGYVKISFIDVVKEMTSIIYDWDIKLLSGDTDESRQWLEKEDLKWSIVFGYSVTPKAMIETASNCLQTFFHPDILNGAIENRIEKLSKQHKNIVIMDVLSHKEFCTLKKCNTVFIKMCTDDKEEIVTATFKQEYHIKIVTKNDNNKITNIFPEIINNVKYFSLESHIVNTIGKTLSLNKPKLITFFNQNKDTISSVIRAILKHYDKLDDLCLIEHPSESFIKPFVDDIINIGNNKFAGNNKI